MTPNATALAGQLQAANADAERVLHELAARYDGEQPTWTSTVSGPVRVILDRFATRLARREFTMCHHLAPDALGPTFWAAWAPGRIRCAACAQAAAQRIQNTPEDRRCDACRRDRGHIHGGLIVVPGAVTELPGRLGVWPPVTVCHGLCCRCFTAGGGTCTTNGPLPERNGPPPR
ncbi:MAG: hypothetical protein ACRDQU_01625 [Pseudonocardiaceae bacterium]